jgi:DNA polymerase I-like protein with 3'-5' exonuclease and polymerase domains
LSKSF